jgi:hypothetical protein
MARYYFHVRRGQVTILDHQGVDLVAVEDAVKEGERRALENEEQVPRSIGAIIVDDDFSRVLVVPFGGAAMVVEEPTLAPLP